MPFTEFLAWATLLVAVPLNVFAAVTLRRAWREKRDQQMLKERYVVAVVTTLVVLFFGVIFVNNDQTIPPIGVEATKVVTRAAMLWLSLVLAGGWLWTYRSWRSNKKP